MLELLADPNKIQQFQVFVECNGIHGDHPTSFELILDDLTSSIDLDLAKRQRDLL